MQSELLLTLEPISGGLDVLPAGKLPPQHHRLAVGGLHLWRAGQQD